MPYFRVHASHNLVLTNFKVMFTSFRQTKTFTKIKRYKAYFLLKQNCTKVHFTVRDPYQKAISLYKDKFQYTPLNMDLTQPVRWEKPQRIFFPAMGLSTRHHSDQQIKDALMNTPFDDFIHLLEKCYWLDEHTQPQHWILNHPRYLLFRNLGVDPKRLCIYKMDKRTELKAFSESTGFDNGRHANSTASINTPTTLNAESLKIINKIYEKDFTTYGYQMRDA